MVEPTVVEEPMVGGPETVPDFLKEDQEPAVIQEPENMEPMDGGPDTVPDFLKEKDEELNL